LAKVKRYQDLIAWQKAYELVMAVYERTRAFPADERFGLTAQLRRAAVSIPSNIAEGWGRQSRTELIRFLEMARGSCYEVQTQMLIADGLRYLQQDAAIHSQIDEVERVLSGLMKSLQNKDSGGD
jgi:four helix bundle protein